MIVPFFRVLFPSLLFVVSCPKRGREMKRAGQATVVADNRVERGVNKLSVNDRQCAGRTHLVLWSREDPSGATDDCQRRQGIRHASSLEPPAFIPVIFLRSSDICLLLCGASRMQGRCRCATAQQPPRNHTASLDGPQAVPLATLARAKRRHMCWTKAV
jgi:hypothetical protein